MKCKHCSVSFHTCSNCGLDSDEEFAFYDMGVCWGCFKSVGGPEAIKAMRDRHYDEEQSLSNVLKGKLIAAVPAPQEQAEEGK